MSPVRKILIADPDLESVRQLSKGLRQRGYQVHYAPDGSKALEVAVLRHPDLTLFDENCKLLEARTFVQILRTNPRTEDIPVVITTSSIDSDRVRGFRDGFLKKPFNLDEVLGRIDHILRRSDAAKDLRGEAKEIEGNLSHLALPDLLQILAMNKRTGRLNVIRGAEKGELFIAEGKPVNAKVSLAEGDKALFRLLAWNDGSFSFTPGSATARVRINRSMEDALLEGMRQADEVARLLPALPPKTSRLSLAADADLSQSQHPVTALVVDLLKQPRTLQELMDLAPATDLDVLSALTTLIQKGVARLAEAAVDEGKGPLLGPAEVHALRSRLFRGKPQSRQAVAKVFVCGSGSAARSFRERLSGFVPSSSDPDAFRSGFGTIGRCEISEHLRIDFCLLPLGDAARPLWRPFSAGAVGAIVIETSDAALRLASYLAWETRVPIAVLGKEVPAEILNAPAGAHAAGPLIEDALRTVLVQAMNPVQPGA